MKYADGNTYTGSWAEGKRHGKGLFAYANGGSYDGDWEEGKRQG